MREAAESIIETLPGELVPALEREFRRGWHREAVEAQINQKRMAQAAHQQGTVRSADGIGRLRMRIDGSAFHYWGQRLGYACWRDKEFLRAFEMRNPEVKVKSGGTKIQVGYERQS